MLGQFKRALVTGGAGFIGSHIVEELLKDGLEVVSIDDYSAGKHANLEAFAGNPLMKEVTCDVCDLEGLKPHFERVDVVFHNAASKKTVCLRDPRRDLDVNAKGTFNILELSREMGVKKVVHASTGSVYGEPIITPQDERHPLDPVSYYGVSKLAGERYAMVFRRLYGMDVTVLRYFHVYGPRQDYSEVGGVVSIFGRRALNDEPPIIFGDGSQERSFTYVKDVVAINKLVATAGGTKGQVYNCASGAKITVQALAESVLRILGREHLGVKYADWTPGDIKVFDVDNSKLKALGFSFATGFEEGLRETLGWLSSYLGKR